MTPPDAKRPAREAPELGSAVRRMLAALARRAAAGDLFALEELARLRGDLALATWDAARGAHDMDGGYSWAEIGAELGVSRQAAQQQYGGERPL